MAQSVFGYCPRFEKLQQIIRPAGLGADAGEFEAAEGLAVDQGAGDVAIDIEVADAEFLARLFECAGLREKMPPVRANCESIGDRQGVVEVARL